MSAAYASTVRVFTSAKLACDDRQLLDSVREAEKKLAALMRAAALPVSESPEGERERIDRVIHNGDEILRDFLRPIDAFVNRGFELYSSHRRTWPKYRSA